VPFLNVLSRLKFLTKLEILRGDRKTAQEMFEFAKARTKRQRILSLNPLVCYEAARRGTLDLILQYLYAYALSYFFSHVLNESAIQYTDLVVFQFREYFPVHSQQNVLNDIVLAAIEVEYQSTNNVVIFIVKSIYHYCSLSQANLEDFITHKLLLFDSFKLEVSDEMSRLIFFF
jgi:hypothetical protein